MISVFLGFQDGQLHLNAQGHAPGGNSRPGDSKINADGFNLACAGFTAIVKTFEYSVSALCRMRILEKREESGLLDILWEKEQNGNALAPDAGMDGSRHSLLVLVRSLQIGCEGLNMNYPGVLQYRLELNELVK